jgi:short-subunit dehydrogenase
MSGSNDKGVAVVTGASAGIGAVYADRLAKRGYDLVVTARDGARLEALAARLRNETGVVVTVTPADLADSTGLHAVETLLRTNDRITLLVNNAGAIGPRSLAEPDLDALEALIKLNVVAATRLSGAAVQGFLARGKGTIVNISSVLALMPERVTGVYSATKAYLLTLSRAQQAELGPRGVHVQVVLPAATRTEIWERSGIDLKSLPPGTVMSSEDMVDAALLGLDRGELVTIPSLPDIGQWEAYEAARTAMAPNFGQDRPAARYRVSEAV